jgi:hypothetical protein
MTRRISTCAKTLGYYVTVPEPIEQTLGSYFENLSKPEQYSLLATLASYMAEQANAVEDVDYTLHDAYCDAPGALHAEAMQLLPKIEQLPDSTILALCEALVINISRTQVIEE